MKLSRPVMRMVSMLILLVASSSSCKKKTEEKPSYFLKGKSRTILIGIEFKTDATISILNDSENELRAEESAESDVAFTLSQGCRYNLRSGTYLASHAGDRINSIQGLDLSVEGKNPQAVVPFNGVASHVVLSENSFQKIVLNLVVIGPTTMAISCDYFQR